jgi:hypothetical protein
VPENLELVKFLQYNFEYGGGIPYLLSQVLSLPGQIRSDTLTLKGVTG